jgi:hypothetical protein
VAAQNGSRSSSRRAASAGRASPGPAQSCGRGRTVNRRCHVFPQWEITCIKERGREDNRMPSSKPASTRTAQFAVGRACGAAVPARSNASRVAAWTRQALTSLQNGLLRQNQKTW